MQGEGGPSAGLNKAIASAVLQQLITLIAGPDLGMVSLSALQPSHARTQDLLSSQSAAWTRMSLLLLTILASKESCVPFELASSTIVSLSAIAQHCESRVGELALDGCDSFELQFLHDTLAQQSPIPFATKHLRLLDSQKVSQGVWELFWVLLKICLNVFPKEYLEKISTFKEFKICIQSD